MDSCRSCCRETAQKLPGGNRRWDSLAAVYWLLIAVRYGQKMEASKRLQQIETSRDMQRKLAEVCGLHVVIVGMLDACSSG